MDLVKQYLEKTRLVSHHIDAFNHLLEFGLQKIVNREPEIVGEKFSVSFGNIWVDKPKLTDGSPMFPNYARKFNDTYDGIIYANVLIKTLASGETSSTLRVPIGRLPIMLGCSACNLGHRLVENEECQKDSGGYFIIRGKERVLVGQMRPAYNKVYTIELKPGDKFTHISEMRSMNSAGASILIKAAIDKNKYCFFSLPYIKSMLPAGLVFKAIRASKTDMLSWIRIKNEELAGCLEEQYDEFETTDECLEYISRFIPSEHADKLAYVNSILENEMFYNVGILSFRKSAIHLAFILKRLISVVEGLLAPDNKCNLSNKRIDGSDWLVGFLFHGFFKQFCKSLGNQLNEKKNAYPLNVIKSLNMLNGMAACFMSSSWTTTKSAKTYAREGVSQVLSVQNYGARLSHLRRTMLPNGVKGKNSDARQLHSSQFSFICPFETPEGERVGLVNNLSLTVDLTIDVSTSQIQVVIDAFETFSKNVDEKVLVLINGRIIGSCADAFLFKMEFEKFRESNLLDNSISIVWMRYADEIHIWSDQGRMIRPLFKLARGTKFVKPDSFAQGLKNGSIVFRDVEELEQSVVAMDELDAKSHACDFMEICPAATMMSVMASVIPFANHSQSPRNAYQACMGKQAIGIPCESFQHRFDTTMHVLCYPQLPLTRSEMVNILKFDEMSSGAMPIVAIMTCGGWNQEDSVILNKGAIDRGLFHSVTFKTIVEEERKKGNSDFESICLPKICYRRRDVNYSHLGPNGVVKQDSKIKLQAGDAIVGKTANKKIKNPVDGSYSNETKDVSVVIKEGEEGFVESVLDVVNEEGVRIVKIKTRLLRVPEIGDKFASSTAQKGTCGMICSQEDMPFDRFGTCPDLIINPHAIPSRMTINMLIEQCFNIFACKTGSIQDATTFAHPEIEKELNEKLTELNLSEWTTQLYCGKTGERFPAKTFVAPAFYQRLKHMVEDKIHARMAGPLDMLTHQPVAGRSRDGGLRFGNMECDATISSGASRMVRELMFDQSDKFELNVCKNCGQVPFRKDFCERCKNELDKDCTIVRKNTPYATKFFYQLLQGMGIKTTIK